MSDLTEQEVIDRLKTSLREAGQAALDLATISRQGRAYQRLREHLGLAEGCCRQLSVFRSDYRWTTIGMAMHKAHEMCGGWLRGFKHPQTGRRIAFARNLKNPLFVKLAENLAMLHETADRLLNRPTGVIGPVLPSLPTGRRADAPIQVKLPPALRKTAGGIIVPDTMH